MAGRPSRKPHEFEVIALNSLRGGPSDMRQVADRARKYLTSEIDSSREQFRIHHLRQPKFAQSLKNLDDRFKSDRTRKYPGSKRDGKEIRSVIYRLGLQAKAGVDAMNSETGWSSTTPKFLDAPKGTLHDLLLAHICKTWQRVCENSSITGCTMSISVLTVEVAIQQIDGRLGDKAKISADSHVAHGVANEDGEENEDLSAGEDHARHKEEWAWVAFKSRLSPQGITDITEPSQPDQSAHPRYVLTESKGMCTVKKRDLSQRAEGLEGACVGSNGELEADDANGAEKEDVLSHNRPLKRGKRQDGAHSGVKFPSSCGKEQLTDHEVSKSNGGDSEGVEDDERAVHEQDDQAAYESDGFKDTPATSKRPRAKRQTAKDRAPPALGHYTTWSHPTISPRHEIGNRKLSEQQGRYDGSQFQYADDAAQEDHEPGDGDENGDSSEVGGQKERASEDEGKDPEDESVSIEAHPAHRTTRTRPTADERREREDERQYNRDLERAIQESLGLSAAGSSRNDDDRENQGYMEEEGGANDGDADGGLGPLFHEDDGQSDEGHDDNSSAIAEEPTGYLERLGH